MTHQRRTTRALAAAAWAGFPAALVLVALLWLGGTTGRVTDDYQLNMRDPATGALPWPFNPWHRYPFFWRPLHSAMCFTVGTLLAEHWRIVMVLCAALYGAMGVGVFALLRRATARRGPAAAGALLLILHPMNYEVPFWLSAAAVSIGIGLWCLASLWAVRLALRVSPPHALELLGFALLAFTVPCFYEQPAVGFAALPLIIAAAWLAERSRGGRLTPLRAAAVRAGVLTGIGVSAAFIYTALLRATAPPTFRGGSGSLAAADRLVARMGQVAESAHWHLIGSRWRQTAAGAWDLGTAALHLPAGLAALAALAALGILWAWAWRTEPGKPPEPEQHSACSSPRWPARAAWIVAGCVLLVGGFAPVVLIDRQNVEPRTLLFPLLGAALALSVALDWALAALRDRPSGATARLAAGLISAATAIAGAVCFVGLQSWHVSRASMDESAAAQLAELARGAPAETVLIPVRIAERATSTGRPHFDRLRLSAFSTPWSATGLMRQAMGRADIHCIAHHPWTGSPLTQIDERGLMCAYELDSRADNPGAGAWIPWERAVPFEIDDAGRVSLVREMVVEHADDSVHVIAPEAGQRAASAGTATACTVVRLRGDPPPPLAGWTWLADSTPVEFRPVTLLGVRREAVRLLPGSAQPGRAAMCVDLPPNSAPRRLNLRACLATADASAAPSGPPAMLRISLFDGDRLDAERSITIERGWPHAAEVWQDVSLDVPASDAPRRLVIDAATASAGWRPAVWVTPGRWSSP